MQPTTIARTTSIIKMICSNGQTEPPRNWRKPNTIDVYPAPVALHPLPPHRSIDLIGNFKFLNTPVVISCRAWRRCNRYLYSITLFHKLVAVKHATIYVLLVSIDTIVIFKNTIANFRKKNWKQHACLFFFSPNIRRSHKYADTHIYKLIRTRIPYPYEHLWKLGGYILFFDHKP